MAKCWLHSLLDLGLNPFIENEMSILTKCQQFTHKLSKPYKEVLCEKISSVDPQKTMKMKQKYFIKNHQVPSFYSIKFSDTGKIKCV